MRVVLNRERGTCPTHYQVQKVVQISPIIMGSSTASAEASFLLLASRMPARVPPMAVCRKKFLCGCNVQESEERKCLTFPNTTFKGQNGFGSQIGF
jgi:hypothetical protein